MDLTEQQVLSLAPDTSSIKAGKAQASLSKWLELKQSDAAIWGKIQGSGKKPYQVQIDKKDFATKCSCPSRKFPCKHALGLLLILANSPQEVKDSEAPEWVTEWLNKRNAKEAQKEKLPGQKGTTASEASRQKRALAREKKVEAGVEELLLWLKDLCRTGLIKTPELPYKYWNGMAERLVDAQAAGLAGRVKQLKQTLILDEDWHLPLFRQIIDLYLICKSFQRSENLPLPIQKEIRSMIGWTYKKEHLLSQNGVKDQWLVLSKEESEEDRIRIEKYWLLGKESRRFGLFLNFVVQGQMNENSLLVNSILSSELIFYPGVNHGRVLIKNTESISIPIEFQPEGLEHLDAVQKFNADQLARFPIARQLPLIVENLTPLLLNDKLIFSDIGGHIINIHPKHPKEKYWDILALSGGSALTMFGYLENKYFYPLGIWFSSKYQLI